MGKIFQQYIANAAMSPRQAPMLFGEVGRDPVINAFVERFGDRWRKMPAKDCWCLTSNGMQFTIIPYRDRWDIAFYDYETTAEFREAFEKKTHVGNAIYFQTEAGDDFTGHAVIRFLQSRDL